MLIEIAIEDLAQRHPAGSDFPLLGVSLKASQFFEGAFFGAMKHHLAPAPLVGSGVEPGQLEDKIPCVGDRLALIVSALANGYRQGNLR